MNRYEAMQIFTESKMEAIDREKALADMEKALADIEKALADIEKALADIDAEEEITSDILFGFEMEI